MKKKRNKKYNREKVIQSVNNIFMKDKLVTFVSQYDNCFLYSIPRNCRMAATPAQAKAIDTQAFNWSIVLAVLGIDDDDEPILDYEVIDTNQKYKQSELFDFLEKKHAELILSYDKDKFNSVGWLASPFKREWTDLQVLNIFENLGGFITPKVQEAICKDTTTR